MAQMKKILREYGPMLLLVGVLYFTGWYRPVMGFLQRGVLATGLFQPSLALDDPMPADFDLRWRDAEGNLHSLAEYRGQTILINVWATWCPPCRAELPDMAALYQTEAGQSMKWIMLSQDEELSKAVDFFERKEYPWLPVQAVGSIPAAYQSQVVPTTFVISPQGEIVVRKEGMAQYNTRRFRQFIQELPLN